MGGLATLHPMATCGQNHVRSTGPSGGARSWLRAELIPETCGCFTCLSVGVLLGPMSWVWG